MSRLIDADALTKDIEKIHSQSWCYVEEMRADYEEFKKEKIKS